MNIYVYKSPKTFDNIFEDRLWEEYSKIKFLTRKYQNYNSF